MGSPEIKALVKYDKETDEYKTYCKDLEHSIDFIKNLRDMISKKIKDFNWPIFLDTKKIEITEIQAEMIEDIFKDIIESVNAIRPKYRTVQNLEPLLDLPNKN